MEPSTAVRIQPWAQDAQRNEDLASILNRAQRGHMRDITEASLQEEIATDGALELSDESSSEDKEEESEEDDEDTAPKKKAPVFAKPSKREDLYAMKRYMMETIVYAREEVNTSLDLMSLVVSKELPKQAQATLRPEIKNRIPMGSIGVDIWHRMPVDQAREAQDALLATNTKMESLQSSADGLLGAAKRMEENVRRETQYWDQILSISSRDWNVCRVPGQQYKLGVRFGFSESAAQFSRKGIAALHPDRDGGIKLERGIGAKPKALRAILRRKGDVVGVSRLPAIQDADETTLEARIRHARDSLFDEELYHELIRESRTLTSIGATIEGSTIHLRNVATEATPDNTEVAFELVSLDEDEGVPAASNDADDLAQATLLAARLLLTQAHRNRLHTRSELPAPMSEKQKEDRPVLPILRPLLSAILHHSALEQLTEYLTSSSRTLDAAKVTVDLHRPIFPPPDGSGEMRAEELLTKTLLRPLISQGTVTFSPPQPLAQADGPPEPSKIEVTLNTAGSLPIFTTRTPTQTCHFSDFPTFASATSTLIASSLASALLSHVQNAAQEFRLREDDSTVVVQDVGVGQRERSFHVEFDGVGRALKVTYTGGQRKVFNWAAAAALGDSDASVKGFFQACSSCLE